jgi:two-component system NarL family response regulator
MTGTLQQEQPGAETVDVLIVEDHQLVAEGLELLLNEQVDIRVVGSAASVEEAVRLAAERKPRVVLMDFQLADGTGAEAAAAIRAAAPETLVLFLSASGNDEALLAAVEAGGVGYLLKTSAASSLIESVRRVAAGEMLIPPEVLAGLLARQRQRNLKDAERTRLAGSLTRREREILHMMSKGLDNHSIAEQIHISVTTVRGHVQSLLEKLSAHSKLEAVARASEFGLLEN